MTQKIYPRTMGRPSLVTSKNPLNLASSPMRWEFNIWTSWCRWEGWRKKSIQSRAWRRCGGLITLTTKLENVLGSSHTSSWENTASAIFSIQRSATLVPTSSTGTNWSKELKTRWLLVISKTSDFNFIIFFACTCLGHFAGPFLNDLKSISNNSLY